MNKKIFLIFLLILIISLLICSYSFAETQTGNMIKNTGNNIGNAISGITNDVKNGASDLTNSAKNIMGNMSNTKNEATNALNSDKIHDYSNENYTAIKTSNEGNNLLGLSNTAWTWLIVGIVGLIIVALVWYYGSQYEHKNYNND